MARVNNGSLSSIAGNPQGAYAKMYLLDLLWNHSSRDMADAFMAEFGYPFHASGFSPHNANCLQVYWYLSTREELFVVVNGIEGFADGLSVYDGYLQLDPLFSRTVNEEIQNWTNWLIANVVIPWGSATEIHLIGHSAGGGIVAGLKGNVPTSTTNPPDWHLTQFGCPKGGDAAFLDRVRYTTRAHWFNDDDAVPLIPPTDLVQAVAFCAARAIAIPKVIDFGEWRGRIQIAIDGTLTVTPPFHQTGLIALVGIAEWLASLAVGADSPHTTKAYLSRLALTYDLYQPAANLNPADEGAGGGDEPAPNVLRNAIAAFEVRLAADAAAQNAVPVEIPTQFLFSVRREGRIWTTLLNGVPVAIGPHKRAARALARFGNAFIRRLQSMGVVIPGDLAEQLTVYLASATDPAAGFRPVMNATP